MPAASVSPGALKEILSGDSRCQLVDVREYPEYVAGHVPGAVLAPLSIVESWAPGLDRSRTVYVLCQHGMRAERAARRLDELGFDPKVVEGGTSAWAAAGYPLRRESAAGWSMERQVRLVSGFLALSGAVLGALAHPGFYALSGFVGAGMVFAALTDTCAMGLFLARMPWNKPPRPQ